MRYRDYNNIRHEAIMKKSHRTSFRYFLVTTMAVSLFATTTIAAPNDKNYFSIGTEGFYDTYNEPGPDVKVNTYGGSITGKWIHNWQSYFTAVDLRYSIGNNDYKSPSGTYSGARQDETDDRIRLGMNLGAFAPYTGLGLRYFADNSKGEVTSRGAGGYDRRITQLYVPLGLSYTHTTNAGWTITPDLEYDRLAYGNVNSRLGTIPGFYNIDNRQHSGYGVRGELMVGWKTANNKTELQCGPFFRYWNVNNSAVTVDPVGRGWIEPKNNRTTYGVALRILW